MASKSSSLDPNATLNASGKQTRSRKAANPIHTESGRAGSAGGILLDKEQGAKTPASSKSTSTPPVVPGVKAKVADPVSPANKPRRKPRKLNKEPVSPLETTTKVTARTETSKEAISELDALKSRVRGLEAKVEELYQSSADTRATRSPRRRGKGRKASSSTQIPTVNTTSVPIVEGEELELDNEEADEELVRLQGELEVARQDLDSYRPRTTRRITSQQLAEQVEEIPRDSPSTTASNTAGERQVTLSGSYRIPIPANVSVEDVKNIKSGVSAAQKVARTFLEQRRAAAALHEEQNLHCSTQSTARTAKPPSQGAPGSSMGTSVDIMGDKQSWGEWIGGYSMAITRAVKNIEHEAAMESKRSVSIGGETRFRQAERSTSTPAVKKGGGKRPPAKTKISNEQVQVLMS